jgi:hypothetical protein
VLIDFLALPLASLPLVIAFVRGKDRFVPSIFYFQKQIEQDDIDKDFSGIRCPSCKWRPTREDTWACSPGCGEVWNTFQTHGECPGCQRRWPSTQCTRCGVWSDHDAWYEERPQPRR